MTITSSNLHIIKISTLFHSTKCLRQQSDSVTSGVKTMTCPRQRSSLRWTLYSEKEMSWSGKSLPGGWLHSQTHAHWVMPLMFFLLQVALGSFSLCVLLPSGGWSSRRKWRREASGGVNRMCPRCPCTVFSSSGRVSRQERCCWTWKAIHCLK